MKDENVTMMCLLAIVICASVMPPNELASDLYLLVSGGLLTHLNQSKQIKA